MKFQPLNRFILITRCEDPRRHGQVHVAGQDGMGFGLVEAIDENSTAGSVIEKGDVIYFPADAQHEPQVVVLDDEKFYYLVHEGNVMGVAKEVNAKRVDNTLKNRKTQIIPVNAAGQPKEGVLVAQ